MTLATALPLFKTVQAHGSHNTFVKPGELIDVIELTPLTLQDRRIYNMLLANAWHDIEQDKIHVIAKKELRHQSDTVNFRVSKSLDRLMGAFVKVQLERNGKSIIQRISLLGTNEEEHRQDGLFRYQFPAELRDIIKQSTVFARLQKTIMYSFKCKYALALYEIVQKRGQLKYKTYEDFEIETFRGLLGVAPGKLKGFGNFKAWAINPAVKEVNFLSDYQVSAEPLKAGKTVTKIRLTWQAKSKEGMQNLLSELSYSSTGRKARMRGQAEVIARRQIGTKTFEQAKALVLEAGTGWDIYAIEQQFFDYIDQNEAPSDINKAFIGFVRKKITKQA